MVTVQELLNLMIKAAVDYWITEFVRRRRKSSF